MKITIFLIALYIGADLHDRGYPSFAWAVILVALYEAILADWFVSVKERWSSIKHVLNVGMDRFREIKLENKNKYLAQLEVLSAKAAWILLGMVAAPFVLFHVLFGEGAGFAAILLVITVTALIANPGKLQAVLEPYLGHIVVGVECMHCWYWVADFCEEIGVEFIRKRKVNRTLYICYCFHHAAPVITLEHGNERTSLQFNRAPAILVKTGPCLRRLRSRHEGLCLIARPGYQGLVLMEESAGQKGRLATHTRTAFSTGTGDARSGEPLANSTP